MPNLTWSAVTGAVSYSIYRSTSSDGTYTKIGNTKNLSYSDTGVQPNTTYYYKLVTIADKTNYLNSIYSAVVSITTGNIS